MAALDDRSPRQRVRRTAGRVVRSLLREPPEASGAPAELTADRFARRIPPGELASEQGAATRRLRARLTLRELEAIETLILADPALAPTWEHAAPAVRNHVLLHFGVHLADASMLEKTGLTRDQPPEDVHAMARGPLAAAGGLYEADLVSNALESVGIDPAAVRSGLDFGCSSGRVVRVLQAAYPETRWHGCDPNDGAIAWAGATLPGIEFFVSGDAPPLPLADGSLDLAYAISIWSHFAPGLGLRWFDEMHRLLQPGGTLVFTTHGVTSVGYYATGGARSLEQSEEIVHALYTRGWWYAAEFGELGDWGVTNRQWGTAFLTPEWLLSQLLPRWRVLEFAPGRNLDNQDVFVLERV